MSLKHAILVLLEAEEGSGYDLLKRFQAHLGFFWNASHQQIYLELKKMHASELIRFQTEHQAGKPNKKTYSITELGRDALIDWIQSHGKPNKVNDALLVKLYAGSLVEPETLMTELQLHKKNQTKILETFKQLEQEYLNLAETDKQPYRLPYLTLRRGIIEKEGWLQWADEVETELRTHDTK